MIDHSSLNEAKCESSASHTDRSRDLVSLCKGILRVEGRVRRAGVLGVVALFNELALLFPICGWIVQPQGPETSF
jgi:hypothetical protein